jgi:Flp pilus assembly protein TadG
MFAAARRRIKDRRGQSLVETAVVLPILLLLFCGIVDFGWIMGNQIIAENASREGARLGSVIADQGDCRTRVEERVLDVVPEFAHDGIEVDTQISGGDVKVTVTYTFNLLTPITQIVFGSEEYTVTTDCVMKAE